MIAKTKLWPERELWVSALFDVCREYQASLSRVWPATISKTGIQSVWRWFLVAWGQRNSHASSPPGAMRWPRGPPEKA